MSWIFRLVYVAVATESRSFRFRRRQLQLLSDSAFSDSGFCTNPVCGCYNPSCVCWDWLIESWIILFSPSVLHSSASIQNCSTIMGERRGWRGGGREEGVEGRGWRGGEINSNKWEQEVLSRLGMTWNKSPGNQKVRILASGVGQPCWSSAGPAAHLKACRTPQIMPPSMACTLFINTTWDMEGPAFNLPYYVSLDMLAYRKWCITQTRMQPLTIF